MRLTLVPPSSLLIPEALQSHDVAPPRLPKNVRAPQVYTVVRRSLYSLGIEMPSLMCADRTVWWSLAVDEVVWDCDTEMVEVTFTDGSIEQWAMVAKQNTPSFDDGDDEPAQDSSRPMLDRLNYLCNELRNAYEDVSLGTIILDDEADYAQLMTMAADPSAQMPVEWCAAAMDPDANSDDEDSSALRQLRELSVELRLTSEEDKADLAEQAQATGDIDLDFEEEDELSGTRGRLIHRRRPTRLPAADIQLAANGTSSNRPEHDVLSFVALLSEVRQTLMNFWSSSVLGELQKRVDAPTYAIWAAESAIKWCLNRALFKSGQVATEILKLLDDNGEMFDVPSSPSSSNQDELGSNPYSYSSSSESDTDDDKWAFRSAPGRGTWQKKAETRREQNLRRNVLYEMRDDFALRTWCIRAQARANEVDDAAVNEAWGARWISAGGASSSVGPPRFTNDVQAWEVSKRYPRSLTDGELTVEKVKGTKKKAAKRKAISARPPTGSSPSRVGNSPAATDVGTSDEGDSLDDDDDDVLPFGSAHAPTYFYPEDAIGQALLPNRLPKRLVQRNSLLGPEMSAMRSHIHLALNDLAGLQKKILELQTFVVKKREEWEEDLASQREQNKGPRPAPETTKPRPPSSLRNVASAAPPSPPSPPSTVRELALVTPPRPPTSSPPPRTSKSSPSFSLQANVPLRHQPLRQIAADNVVAQHISSVIQGSKVAQKATRRGVKRKTPPASLVPSPSSASGSGSGNGSGEPSPRKKARENLLLIETVLEAAEAQQKRYESRGGSSSGGTASAMVGAKHGSTEVGSIASSSNRKRSKKSSSSLDRRGSKSAPSSMITAKPDSSGEEDAPGSIKLPSMNLGANDGSGVPRSLQPRGLNLSSFRPASALPASSTAWPAFNPFCLPATKTSPTSPRFPTFPTSSPSPTSPPAPITATRLTTEQLSERRSPEKQVDGQAQDGLYGATMASGWHDARTSSSWLSAHEDGDDEDIDALGEVDEEDDGSLLMEFEVGASAQDVDDEDVASREDEVDPGEVDRSQDIVVEALEEGSVDDAPTHSSKPTLQQENGEERLDIVIIPSSSSSGEVEAAEVDASNTATSLHRHPAPARPLAVDDPSDIVIVPSSPPSEQAGDVSVSQSPSRASNGYFDIDTSSWIPAPIRQTSPCNSSSSRSKLEKRLPPILPDNDGGCGDIPMSTFLLRPPATWASAMPQSSRSPVANVELAAQEAGSDVFAWPSDVERDGEQIPAAASGTGTFMARLLAARAQERDGGG